MPPDLPLPEPNVAPLRARGRLRWLLIAWGATLGLAIIIIFATILLKD